MQQESSRQQVLTELDRVIREATGLGQMFSAAVAAKVGLGGADLEYLDIISMHGRLTAGELAEATGLTTGAVTGVVDRLEKAGFVQRERDTEDRRRIFVTAREDGLAKLWSYYRPMSEAVATLTEQYSDEQLALFVDYFGKSREIMRAQLKRVKA